MGLPARTTLPKLTDRYPLGTAGLEVSPFCLGITANPDVVTAAYEAGINFFFVSADMHWPLYDGLREGLRKLLRNQPAARDQIVVAVVAYVTQREFLWAPFQEVVAAVPELRRVDVTVAGGSYGHELSKRRSVFEAHREQRFMGTRGIAASFHDRQAAVAEIAEGVFDLAFVRYSAQYPKASGEVFDKVAPRGEPRRTLLYNFKSTVGYLPDDAYGPLGIGEDYWRPHVTDHYRFVLSEPALDGVLCSLPTPAAVTELADALAKGPLDEDDRQYLRDLGRLALGNASLQG